MQEALEHTLAELVAIPSESKDPESCRQVIEYVRGQLEPLGLHITAEMDSEHPWLIATTQAGMSPNILLAAHLDVVPAIDPSQYELRKTGERLYGRGACDMKYAAAVFLEFLKANKKVLPGLDLGVLFTTDEEIGGHRGAAEVLQQGWRSKLAFIPDVLAGWQIEESAKGMLRVEICAHGKSAHGSRPWEGDSATQKLIPALHELQTAYTSKDKLGPTLGINMLSGGKAINQIPDNACAWADFRAFHDAEIEEYRAFSSRLGKKYDLEINETLTGSPLTLDKNNELVKQFMVSLQNVGIEPSYRKSYGATDGRWFAAYGIPCIVTGPHGEGSHGSEEWMRRQDLVTFYAILEDFVHENAKIKAAPATIEATS